jgi:DNA-binding NarL/FixJ family response regulator
MIDGRFIQDDGMALLEAILHRFPAIRVVMMLAKKEARWVSSSCSVTSWPLFPATQSRTMFSAVLDSVSKGWSVSRRVVKCSQPYQHELSLLSERQREVLKLLAAGSRIKRLAAI